jgi:hypothetical protein
MQLLGATSNTAPHDGGNSSEDFMSNIAIRDSLEKIRTDLYSKNTRPLIWNREKFYPSRLEGFAALAAVVKEIGNN